MRLALGIEYDGSRFLGWQTQPGGATVQDAVESALGAIADAEVRTICAGRTDRGVHACEQVIHFDTSAERRESAWVRGTNALLPDSVAVLWSCAVAGDFHARYSALSRTYRYVLLNRPVRPALSARRVGWFHQALDVAAMRDGAAHLLGEHDFTSFRSAECQAKSPVRTVESIAIELAGDRVDFRIRANAFLQHMVRNIVGTLVYVGAGRRRPEWVGEVLRARDRAQAAPTFAAEGLYLEAIRYAEHWGLPAGTRRAPELVVQA
ncbi:MAG: tRNA pseudouridine(38-40) synthase TruA [Burkholderiales bacterium]